jgi:hypothetical protein
MKRPGVLLLSLALGPSSVVSGCFSDGGAVSGQVDPGSSSSSSSGPAVDPPVTTPTTTESTGPVTTGSLTMTSTSGAPDDDSSSETGVGSTSTDSSSSGATDGSTENCGNGVLDPGEGCDDGYAGNSDVDGKCTLACQPAVCGDGLVWQGHENCDLGPNNNDDLYGGCTTQCQAGPACNDGQIQGPEECDNGSDNGTSNYPDGGVPCTDVCRFNAKMVFVSSKQYVGGEIGGAGGAHAECQDLAKNAGFDNHTMFKAFISDAYFNPAAHFVHNTIPYVLPNGTRVADNWDDLVLEGPNPGITLTETGVTLPMSRVWTGTYPDGTKFPDLACANWTKTLPKPEEPGSSDNYARTGRTFADAKGWASKDSLGCDLPARLYCVEQ